MRWSQAVHTGSRVSRPPAAKAQPIDMHTPLMDAGLKSSQAVRLAARVRELCGADVSATLVFEHPTPHAIATHLATLGGSAALSGDDVVTLVSEYLQEAAMGATLEVQPEVDTSFGNPSGTEIPASTFQQHFLLLHLLQPHAAAFSLPIVAEWPGQAMPQPVVRAALQLLVRRHAVLRTFYRREQHRVSQVVLPADGFVVPLDECTPKEWAAKSSLTQAMPFALTEAPPVRALLSCSARPALRLKGGMIFKVSTFMRSGSPSR